MKASPAGRPGSPPLALVLALVVALSWGARELRHQRVHLPGRESWITTDADTLYHLRRVERAIREGLPVAERDPYLNYPHGSPIPWPPYYTVMARAVVAPFAPDDPQRLREYVERRVASLPMLFGVATSVLAALAGRALAGNAGALMAGAYHALCPASIAYSKSGNGDHHAWITMLAGATLLGLSATLGRRSLTAREGLVRGTALGAVSGVALGSWVASFLSVIPVQLILGWWIVRHSRRPSRALPAFGLSFHLAALLVLLPALLSSPWKDAHPWIVVNLSWFHAAWLLLAGLIFVPLFFLREGAALRSYPWGVAGALAILGALLGASQAPPVAGIREGFAWMGREQDFMASVWESRGLIGGRATFDPLSVLGYGVLLLPFAWAGAAWLAFRRDRLELLPWAVNVPLLALQAARQVRFGDALALPMAVVLAWGSREGIRAIVARRRPRNRARLPAWGLVAVLLLGAGLAQGKSTLGLLRLAASGKTGTPEHPSAVVAREMCEWLRQNSSGEDYSVLSRWNWGHAIEWAADRPSVATNFGTFVGEDSFRDPSRFFLTEDPGRAEAILEKRRSRYVLLTSYLSGTLRQMIRDVAPERERRYLDPGPEDDAKIRFEWFRTLGARLMFDGTILTPDGGAEGALDFVRLVHASPRRDPRLRMRGSPSPAGWVWERVPGAVLEARGEPGDELRVTLRVRYPAGRYEMEWSHRALADAEGLARLRVPYATDGPNGDGRVVEAAWEFGERAGALEVPGRAVAEADTVRLP